MHSRNAGLQRLRTVTRRIGIVTAALTGIFAGLAAASNSGHHRHAAGRATASTAPPSSTSGSSAIPPPPALPRLGGDDGATPAPVSPPSQPAQPPVQTQAPPVAVSGGS